jgi:hypothetical protein
MRGDLVVRRDPDFASAHPGYALAAPTTRGEFNVVRDCRIAPAIGRRQKISDSSAKGKHFRESTKCGRG